MLKKEIFAPHRVLPPSILSIAPMMRYTDRHFRRFMRLLSKDVWLYTEMISASSLLHGNTHAFLRFTDEEHPLVLQLGGNNATELAQCVSIACDYNYDEINLNVGCPSPRVIQRGFGAALMACPDKTATIVNAMCTAVSKKSARIPITVKCRAGIDGSRCGLPCRIGYDDLYSFVSSVRRAGASKVTVHARAAILGSISPRKNFRIPPLQYELMRGIALQLKRDDRSFSIEVNGGITSLEEAEPHLAYADSVMIGRAAINSPYTFSDADAWIARNFACTTKSSLSLNRRTPSDSRLASLSNKARNTLQHRHDIAHSYAAYLHSDSIDRSAIVAHREMTSVRHTRALSHLLHLYAGIPGARKWRQRLTWHIARHSPPKQAVADSLRIFS